jgi:hypothetical protein
MLDRESEIEMELGPELVHIDAEVESVIPLGEIV